MIRVLVVEDEEDLRELLAHSLRGEGYEVACAADGAAGLEQAASFQPQVILADVMMPRLDGVAMVRRLRDSGSTAALLMVTARGGEEDVVAGLTAGADDYLVKPFKTRELLARIAAVLRRSAGAAAPGAAPAAAGAVAGVRIGELEVDAGAHRVLVAGTEAPLTHTEFGLLHAFLRHRNVVLSRDQLLDQVWGHDAEVFDRTIDVHVKNLRRKLGAAGDWIHTVRGAGYRFTPPRA